MEGHTLPILALLTGYLIGSIPTAFIIGIWVAGIDITQHGSGNVGGTNSLRVLGPLAGITVTLIDIGKGFVAVMIARIIFGATPWNYLPAALGVVIGHNWSVYLHFKGGKGIAVTIGLMLFLFPREIWILLPFTALLIAITRYVSLASLTFVTLVPVMIFSSGRSMVEVVFTAILALIAFWRHRGNIQRLMNGTERKITFSKKSG